MENNDNNVKESDNFIGNYKVNVVENNVQTDESEESVARPERYNLRPRYKN